MQNVHFVQNTSLPLYQNTANVQIYQEEQFESQFKLTRPKKNGSNLSYMPYWTLSSYLNALESRSPCL